MKLSQQFLGESKRERKEGQRDKEMWWALLSESGMETSSLRRLMPEQWKHERASNGLHMGPIPHNTPVTAITTAAANVNQRAELAGNRNW